MSDSSDKSILPPPGGPPRQGPPKTRPPLPKPNQGLTPANPPELALGKQAPGVKNSRQAPEVETLKTGDTIGGRFQVERYLGSSGGGVSYLCRDKKTGDVLVVKVLDMPFPGDDVFQRLSREISLASSITHRNLSGAVGMGRTGKGSIFIAMEFVEGATLSQLVAKRREEGRTLSLRDTFTVLAHTANALEEVHKRGLSHGVLTPYNVYVNKEGVVKVGNLGFGRMVSTYLHSLGEGPFVDSIYVAPEVAENPKQQTPASDLYSLGMIAAELLSPLGLPAERKQAQEVAIDAISNYPPSLFSLVTSCLSRDKGSRPASVQVFRDEFEEIAREAGAKLCGPPPAGALPIEPAVEEVEEGEPAFDLFDLGEIGEVRQESEDRYLVQKAGLDYGPFTVEQILEQLHADEINERSQVLDRLTQERRALEDVDVFRADVLAYIPIREERLRREAAARAELQRKVKKGGVAALIMGIVGGVVVLLAMGWFWLQQPAPEPLPLDRAFASKDYQFSPPPTEFQQVEVDSDVMESIFNPNASEEEVARQVARVRRQAAPSPGAPAGRQAEEEEVYVVDMGSDAGSTHHLTDREINAVIMADFAAMRECIMLEVRQNRSFRGVTVRFFIRPSGTTGGVGLREREFESRPVGQCLIQRFQFLQFPEHGAINNRGVEFPILLQ